MWTALITNNWALDDGGMLARRVEGENESYAKFNVKDVIFKNSRDGKTEYLK